MGTPSASPAASPVWTPPPIPKPLPTQGGVPPTPVGAAATTEQPAASPAPSGSPPANQAEFEEPGSQPQPAGSPGAASPVAATTPAPSATVTMTPDFKFDPAEVTIKTGQSIAWTNEGRSPQTVTCNPAKAKDKSHAVLPQGAQPFDSGAVNYGETFIQTFTVAGDYVYFSIPHEDDGMVGKITVQ
jgi:plastocyanin